MGISTKYFSLPPNIYMKECFLNTIKSSYIVSLLCIACFCSYFYFYKLFLLIFPIVLESIYLIFTFLQFYIMQYIPQSKIMFQKMYLEFDGDRILMHFMDKGCALFSLSTVKKIVRRKEYYILFLSKIQIIYVPKTSFCSQFEVNMFDLLLEKKHV